jgi:AraC-like DNA-binding protein
MSGGRNQPLAPELSSAAPFRRAESAIFTAPKTTYHADTCDLLKQAADRREVRLSAFGRRGYPGLSFPPRLLPELPSIGCWDAPHDQSWGLGWHRNEGIEFTFLARGRIHFAVDEKTYALESGALTITRPWQKHRVGNPFVRASRLHWLIIDLGVRRPNQPWCWPSWLMFSTKDREHLTTLLRYNEQPVWTTNAPLREAFEKVAGLLEAGDPVKVETPLKICVNSLFLELLQLLESKHISLEPSLSSTHRTVGLFLSTLPDHLDQPWDLDTMAHQCGLGRTRFAHYCQEITNQSPAKYLLHCRLELASKLLRAALDRNLTDIAFDCGFESSQYFAFAFHREFGCTPSEYRKRFASGKK